MDKTFSSQRLAQGYYTELISSMEEGFCVIEVYFDQANNPTDYRYLQVNSAFETLTGLSNVAGKLVSQISSVYEKDWLEKYAQAALTGKQVRFEGFNKLLNRYFDIHAFRVDVPESHRVAVLFHDITQRKALENELGRLATSAHEERRKYEAIISATPDLMYIFDLNHRFTYANEALLRMWGRSWDEAIGKNCLELGYEQWHAQMHDREIEQVIATKKSIKGEVPFNGTNGRRIYEYIFVPVFNSRGEVEAVAGTTRDVTERKKIEEELRDLTKNLEKRAGERTLVLQDQTHRLKQLAIELTEAEQNERKKLAEILHDHLQQLLVAAQMRLTVLARTQQDKAIMEARTFIDQAFDASRSLTVQLSPPALYEEGLGTALKLLAEKIESQYKVKVDLHIAGDAKPEDEAIKTIIYKCVQELLFNVIKYAKVDQCSLIMRNSDNRRIEVTVKDQGVGFNAKNIETKPSGGYGLSSIRERIRSLGGEFQIVSSPGQGTESKIIVPQRLGLSPGGFEKKDLSSPVFFPKGTLLIVDDNEANRLALDAVLKSEGYHLLFAASGLEALSLLKNFDVDIVLLDIQMPELDGYEVAKRIKQMPHCHNVLIILITAVYKEDVSIKKGYEAGAIDYFTKPFDWDILKQKLAIYSSFRQKVTLLKEGARWIKESKIS